MRWWYEANERRAGPVGEAELQILISQGKLNASTLVWREGLAEWTELKDVPPLAARLPAEPPALPPRLPNARDLLPPRLPNVRDLLPISYGSQSSVGEPHLARVESYAPSVDAIAQAHDQVGQVAPEINVGSGHATWYRFFARQIDLLLFGFPSIFLSFLAIGLVASPAFALRIQDEHFGPIAAIVLWCVVQPMAEAVVWSIFGNTPGKALFGLKVHSLSDHPLTLGDRAKRAYRVMIYGLGFYLPFISLFTAISQHRRIKQKGSAGYDVGLFRVSESNISGIRKLLAVSTWVMSFTALLAFYQYDRNEQSRIASPKPWTNSVTFVETIIPGGWDVSNEVNPQGQTVHIFTKAADAIQVVFGSEDVPVGPSLDTYISAFIRVSKSTMLISSTGASTLVAGHPGKTYAGELLSPKAPIEVTFVKRDNKVWRTVVLRLGGASAQFSVDELRAALFKTVPPQ